MQAWWKRNRRAVRSFVRSMVFQAGPVVLALAVDPQLWRGLGMTPDQAATAVLVAGTVLRASWPGLGGPPDTAEQG